MYTISNNTIEVSILDPIEDIQHLGSRYCTGGYIWQIQHRVYGKLLSGPYYPSVFPPPFDGQGAPEIFESVPSAETTAIGDSVVVPGVGLIKKTSAIVPFHVRNNPEVNEFCTWEVSQEQSILSMKTTQSLGKYVNEITRTITLTDTVVTSKTDFFYHGSDLFSLRWFAHPFFPLNADNRCCRFSLPVGIAENHAFSIDINNTLLIKKTIDRSKSSYTLLRTPEEKRIRITQFHPKAGIITISPDFKPSKIPVWTNESAFSLEPYFEKRIQSGEHVSWGISYHF